MNHSETRKQEFLMKINEQEEEVLSLLRQGWELGKSCVTGNYWAQQDGLSSGKTAIGIHFRTIEFLLEKGLIYIARDDGKLPTLYCLK